MILFQFSNSEFHQHLTELENSAIGVESYGAYRQRCRVFEHLSTSPHLAGLGRNKINILA